jgi:hypothetical protein
VDAVLRRMFLLYLFYQHVANDFCSLFVLSSNALTISMALVVVPAIAIPRSMSDKANSEHDTTRDRMHQRETRNELTSGIS